MWCVMTEAEINWVCERVLKGGRLLIGRDPAGRQKLKVKHGPFGLFTERFICSEEDLHIVKSRLAARRFSKAIDLPLEPSVNL